MKKLVSILMLSAVPLFGAIALVRINQSFGLGVAHDSFFYVAGAKHLAAGKGYSVYAREVSPDSQPLKRYCPALSVLLALFFRAGFDIKTSVLILNTFLFAANLFLVGLLIRRFSGSAWLGVLTGIFFLFDDLWVEYHSWILTEPLFLFLVTNALLLLGTYFGSGKNRYWAAAAVLTGFSAVTRYTGVAYIAAGAMCLFLFEKAPLPGRLKKSALFGALASAPLALWLLRNMLLARRSGMSASQMALGDLAMQKAGRPQTVFQYLQQTAECFMRWFENNYALFKTHLHPDAVLVLWAVGLAAGAFVCWKTGRLRPKSPAGLLFRMLAIYAAAYMIFLIGSLTAANQTFAMDIRYLVEPFELLVLGAVLGLQGAFRRIISLKKPALLYAASGILAVYLFLWFGQQLSVTQAWARETLKTGADRTKGFGWWFMNTRTWLPTDKNKIIILNGRTIVVPGKGSPGDEDAGKNQLYKAK